MQWSINDTDVLFTGDLNKTVGELLADDPRMQADILKIPHHGGRSLVPNAFYDRVKPDIALVPGPEWVWCGERGVQTRNWVADNKIPTWVNGIDGHVRLSFKGKQLSISPNRPSQCRDQNSVAPNYPAYLKPTEIKPTEINQ